MVSHDERVAWCRREPSQWKYGTGNGPGGKGYLHWISWSDRPASYIHPSHTKPKKKKDHLPPSHWKAENARFTQCDQKHIHRLAESLGVSTEALGRLAVGWNGEAWTLPMRDAAGAIVGMIRRWPNGDKKTVYRSPNNQLFFDPETVPEEGRLLLPEGASDVAALYTIGLPAVGRTSNTAGKEALAELLANRPEVTPIVLAEYDQNEKGHWPGRDGAISTAQHVANHLMRTVYWAFPPGGLKDARNWLNTQKNQNNLGKRFMNGLELHPIHPQCRTEPYEEPKKPTISLEEYRQQMVDNRAKTIGKPGVYLDCSPTGAGKSYADLVTIQGVEKSRTFVPTHALAKELVSEMQEQGLEAAAPSPLDKETCKNFNEASQAMAAGFRVGSTVCIDCEHQKNCTYYKHLKESQKAPHQVATHSRASFGLSKLTEGAEFVSIHEDSVSLLARSVSFSPSALPGLRKAIQQLKDQTPTSKTWLYQTLITLLEWIGQMDDMATAETTQILKPEHQNIKPDNLERKLWKLLKSYEDLQAIDGKALKALVSYAMGELAQFAVLVDHKFQKSGNGETVPIRQFVAVWKTAVPLDVPVWFQDATADPEIVRELVGRETANKTPEGVLAAPVEPVQLPRDISMRTSLKVVAATVAGILESRPNALKVGIIAHKKHIVPLLSNRANKSRKKKKGHLLPHHLRKRIAKYTWFGRGDDRGSNAWQGLDLILVLGTPRVNPINVRQLLVILGKHDAARLPAEEAGWSEYKYQAKRTTGELAWFDGYHYKHPDWQAAYRYLVVSQLKQAAGRGRGVLAGGTPVLVVSNENTGFPVVRGTYMAKIAQSVTEAVEALKDLLEAVSGCSENAINNNIGESEQWIGVQTTTIAARIEKSKSRTTELLKQAEALNLVERSPLRKGGWRIPPENPEESTEFAPDNHAQDATGAEKPIVGATRTRVGKQQAAFKSLLEELQATGSPELVETLFAADQMPLKDAAEIFSDP